MEGPLTVPDWLNNEFLTQSLQKEEGKQNTVITNFTVTPAVPAGNNYGSVLYRVKVEYKNSKDDKELHCLSLIVKSELTDGVVKEYLDASGPKEPVFYNKFIPEANKLTSLSFAPKVFFSSKSSVIVLEDLKEQGFVMANRLEQLDFDHCCLYAKAAASLHAISFAVHKMDPEFVETLGKEIIPAKGSDSEKVFKNMVKSGMKCLAIEIGKTEKFKKYQYIIEGVSETLWDMICDSTAGDTTVKTLTQGDPWIPNMMFKYDYSGAVKEVKLLDFQDLQYLPPANDIHSFVWSSANHDVKINRLGDLYKIYLDIFNDKLQELNCSERLTFESFMENIRCLSPMALYLVGTMIPNFYDPIPIDYNDFIKNENCFEKYYNDTNFTKVHLPKLLEELELAGVFEYFEKYLK